MTRRTQYISSIIASLVLMATSSHLLANNALLNIDVKPQSTATALLELAESAGIQIIFPEGLGAVTQAPAVKGDLTINQALDQLLKNTDLQYEFTSEDMVVIKPKHNGVSLAAAGLGANAAEDVGSTDSQQRPKYIEEVIVTATKRETSLQDTAMSITALGSEEINRRSLTGMGDYLNSIPGVSFLDAGANVSSIVIRGLSVDPQLGDATVGVYLGETPITALGFAGNKSSDLKMVDLGRVEVLRGPQGSLYGSASIGGTVKNIPNKPNLTELEGNIKAGYSNTSELGGSNWDFRSVINIPIIEDRLAVRAVGYQIENSGYYENIAGSDPDYLAIVNNAGAVAVNESNIGHEEYTGGRVTLLWKPLERLSLNLSYLAQNLDEKGWGSTDIEKGTFSQARLQVRTSEEVGAFSGESRSDDIEIANALITYDLGWAEFLSSTSWIENTTGRKRDLTPFFVLIGSNVPWSQPDTSIGESYSQEFRLASQLEGPFQFLLGYFYEDREIAFHGFGFHGGIYGTSTWPNSPDLKLLEYFLNTNIRESSFFGEVSFDFTDKISMTVGGRFFSYDKEVRNVTDSFGTLVETDDQSDESDFNGKVGFDFTPNENVLLYATWSQGFRLGRPVSAITNPACDTNNDGIIDGSPGITTAARQIDSDYVDSYELGSKFTLLDQRWQLNIAAYRNDWDGLPVIATYDFCSATINAGSARTQGLEVASIYQLNDALQLSVGASYINGELTTDAPGLGNDGDRLPGSPEFNASLALEYNFTIAEYDAYLRGDYVYVGGFYNNLQETGFEAGDYGRLNLKAGIVSGRYSADIFVNNVEWSTIL